MGSHVHTWVWHVTTVSLRVCPQSENGSLRARPFLVRKCDAQRMVFFQYLLLSSTGFIRALTWNREWKRGSAVGRGSAETSIRWSKLLALYYYTSINFQTSLGYIQIESLIKLFDFHESDSLLLSRIQWDKNLDRKLLFTCKLWFTCKLCKSWLRVISHF